MDEGGSLKKVNRIYKDMNVQDEAQKDTSEVVDEHLAQLAGNKCAVHVYKWLFDDLLVQRPDEKKPKCHNCKNLCNALTVLSCKNCVHFLEICAECKHITSE